MDDIRRPYLYVASSWRNFYQTDVVCALRQHCDVDVYDFKDPEDNGGTGFHWSEIDPDWKSWTPAQYREALNHPIAKRGFSRDWDAMQRADGCVLVQPCGRSAHLELGWFVGASKPTCALLSDGEPELMLRMVDEICLDLAEVMNWAERLTRSIVASA